MLHRIRLAMQIDSFQQRFGDVEIDKTYIGGKVRAPRPGRMGTKAKGLAAGKVTVRGLIERGGKPVRSQFPITQGGF